MRVPVKINKTRCCGGGGGGGGCCLRRDISHAETRVRLLRS